MCVCLWGRGSAQVQGQVWGGLRVPFSSGLSPSVTWDPGIELKSSGLAASTLIYWVPTSRFVCLFFSEWQNLFSLITLRPFLNSTFSGDTTQGFTSSSLHIPKEMRDSERQPEVLEFASYWPWTILRLAYIICKMQVLMWPTRGVSMCADSSIKGDKKELVETQEALAFISSFLSLD